MPNVHGKVGNKTEQNIQIPRATPESTQIHFQRLCGVALGMDVSVSIQPLLLMKQLASCSLNEPTEGGLPFGDVGLDWSGRKHVFTSFDFPVR